jgi:hypothetical protein
MAMEKEREKVMLDRWVAFHFRRRQKAVGRR